MPIQLDMFMTVCLGLESNVYFSPCLSFHAISVISEQYQQDDS